ncbi:lamin tail domain-containing protein [Sphingomicrobium sp. XHP0235]|uniref:lamin tail domain-containing protein n=1 Tax=Sphingomicrobium aquimarinum TaxID=3133971 RepID=UPI0031FF140B
MVAGTNSRIFINEIHYDNDGTDAGEFIEIVAPSGTDLTGWTIVLYNGSSTTRSVYQTIDLSTASVTDDGTNSYFVVSTPGVQNGSPDGIALVDAGGAVVQFLSYEGSFTATDGPAEGLTSTDIGVSETTTSPVGQSLQLTGSGSTYGDFTWATVAAETPGAANNMQTIEGIANLVINEILADPAAGLPGDANGDGVGSTTQDEFVELVNSGNAALDLSGYTLSDGFGVRHTFADGTVLQPGEAIVVFGGGTPTGDFGGAQVVVASTNALGLNNGGDTVTIRDAGGEIAAEFAYGSNGGNDQSLVRDPDLTGEFVLHGGAAGSGGALFSPGTQTDGTAFGSVAASPGVFSIESESIFEGDTGTTELVFTVTRSGGSDGEVSVDYNTGTFVTNNATFGDDFTPQSGTLVFADGETSKTITYTINGDVEIEGDERFAVVLTNPTGGATTDPSAFQAVGTILDDDNPGAFSIGDVSVEEGDVGTTLMTFTVTRDATAGEVTVDFVSSLVSASADDFVSLPSGGTLTFADGEASRTITVEVAGDQIIEGDESVQIDLVNATGGATIADGTATGVIVDDDTPSASGLVINEILYDPSSTSGDANGDGVVNTTNDEFIEIVNTSGNPIDISGYSLSDDDGDDFVFPEGTVLAPGQAAVLFGGGTPTGDFGGALVFVDDGSIGSGLSNSGDVVELRDAAGNLVDSVGYGNAGPVSGGSDQSVTRSPDLVGEFVDHETATGSGGASYSPGTQVGGAAFDAPNPAGAISVEDAIVIEGDDGSSTLAFTVVRGGGSTGEVTLDYDVILGSGLTAADLADFSGETSGQVTLADGQTYTQIFIEVSGDTLGETDESFTLQLSNATGGADIVDATATGTILNDDPLVLEIGEIQGEAHVSPYDGLEVTTTGVVTATDTNGYYIQDPDGDGNSATSDGIFVFTGGFPSVSVGDLVEVVGTVSEFDPGGETELSVTQISRPVSETVLATGQPLPAAIVIGPNGIAPPTEIIEDDNFASYDPLTDGIDFWESLEGMRVTIENPVVVQGTNGFGELWVGASDGDGNILGTNVSEDGLFVIDSENGLLGRFNSNSQSDFNPERIQIDDGFLNDLGAQVPDAAIGDQLGDVTGIVSYGFGNYEVLPSEAIGAVTSGNNVAEVTDLAGSDLYFTVATYNVLNLDPNDADGDTDVADGRFTEIARDIGYSLGAPDVVVLQEVQDNNGSEGGDIVSASVTLQMLVDAIFEERGVQYGWIDTPLTEADNTGGEPGGNIRVAMLYRIDRVDLDPESVFTITSGGLDGARPVLGADFEFNGETITVLGAHQTAKGGSTGLFGEIQPPINNGAERRLDQNQQIANYVASVLAADPDANIVVAGDFNEFQFEEPMQVLYDDLDNLTFLLPENERYSVLFEGNAQQLDHILVSGALSDRAQIDIVHVNTIVEGGASDHDPVLARLLVAGDTPVTGGNVIGTNGNDNILGGIGADVIDGRNGDDFIEGFEGNDILRGGNGNDQLFGGDGDDDLDGGNGMDRLFGGAGNDRVDGGNADDELFGGDGEDLLFGGNGDDLLDGGAGSDILRGGNGDDVFIIDGSATGADGDFIMDLQEGDTIRLTDAGSYSLEQSGEDVLIIVGGEVVATIVQRDVAEVDATIEVEAAPAVVAPMGYVDIADDLMIVPDSAFLM